MFFNVVHKAVIVLFSKIILKRSSRDQINIFWKVEKITKSFIKVNVDLKYLNFMSAEKKLKIRSKIIVRLTFQVQPSRPQ